MARDAIIFTADIKDQALFRKEVLGLTAIYVRLFRLVDGTYVFPADDLVAEGVFHEAVHALSRSSPSSIEEECDGYAAGLCAAAAFTGEALLDVLILDGVPLAVFVHNHYPDKTRNPAYIPVGLTATDFQVLTGINP